MPRRLPAAALAVCAALAAGGCGAATTSSAGSFPKGPEHDVAQVIDSFSSAASTHDPKKICDSILTSTLAASLRSGADDCQKVVGHQLDDTDSFDVTVQKGSVRISGSSATAQVKSLCNGSDRLDTITLTHESAGWRIAGIQSPPCR